MDPARACSVPRMLTGGRGRPGRVVGTAGAVLLAFGAVGCTDDADPAEVVTLEATGVTASSATVEATVTDPSDGSVTYWFEYGPTTGYGSEAARQTREITDRDEHEVEAQLVELAPESTFHVRACAEGEETTCGSDVTFATAAPAEITGDPALFPAFDPVVTDYVTRCGEGSVTLAVTAPDGTEVAVGDAPAAAGTFVQDAEVTAGGSFTVATTTSGATSTYHVRCLPEDFPDWTYDRPGTPSADLYIATPANVATPSGERAAPYVAVFDDHGVPVWWQVSPGGTDAKLLPDGHLGWGKSEQPQATFNIDVGSGFTSYELDGTPVRTWNSIDAPTDFHDFQLLEDGNALIGAYPPREGTMDLTPYGGPATGGTLLEGLVQEITPDDEVVWSWSTEDHVDPSETPDRWKAEFVYGLPHDLPDGRKAFDWAHLNSIHQVDDTVLLSFRHLDAVYAVDKATGDIIWKLGGTPTDQSLTVVGDDETNPLGGQHDARLLPDGTVTVYDNNSEEDTPPRGVRYEIDLEAMTATMVESVPDPDIPVSACCGSSTRLSDGSWVMSWGGTRVIGEVGPDGERHFVLTFTELEDQFGLSYRVFAVEEGGPSLEDLRAGMDAMHADG